MSVFERFFPLNEASRASLRRVCVCTLSLGEIPFAIVFLHTYSCPVFCTKYVSPRSHKSAIIPAFKKGYRAAHGPLLYNDHSARIYHRAIDESCYVRWLFSCMTIRLVGFVSTCYYDDSLDCHAETIKFDRFFDQRFWTFCCKGSGLHASECTVSNYTSMMAYVYVPLLRRSEFRIFSSFIEQFEDVRVGYTKTNLRVLKVVSEAVVGVLYNSITSD